MTLTTDFQAIAHELDITYNQASELFRIWLSQGQKMLDAHDLDGIRIAFATLNGNELQNALALHTA